MAEAGENIKRGWRNHRSWPNAMKIQSQYRKQSMKMKEMTSVMKKLKSYIINQWRRKYSAGVKISM
jgi:hypothetical protein